MLSLAACKKDDDQDQNNIEKPDGLSFETVTLLDSITPIYINNDQLMISDTESVIDFLSTYDSAFYYSHFKSNVIEPKYQFYILTGRMCLTANSIMDTTIIHDDGNGPIHKGVAYSYGSKQYQSRSIPSQGQCNDNLFGMDCSGFIYQLLNNAGLAYTGPNKDVLEEYSSSYIQQALDNSEFNKLKLIKLGNIAPNEIQSGDIIYWDNGPGHRHIGYVWQYYLFNCHGSSGEPNNNCDSPCQCIKNYNHKKRGARSLPLDVAFYGNGFWGSLYNIMRFSEFEVSSNTFDIQTSGGSDSLNLFTQVDWAAQSNQNWLHINNATGNKSGKIHFYADENTTGSSRTAQITINLIPECDFADKIITITQQGSGCIPIASFSNSISNNVVTFTESCNNNGSIITGYSWSFGDGNTSTLQNPSHTYSQSGNFNVCLTATNSCGTSQQVCNSVTIVCSPTASFTSNVSGLDATFTSSCTDNGSPITAYAWDFGDGNTSTQQNPTHSYTTTGNFNVCLTATNACGTSQQYCSSITTTCTGSDLSVSGATDWDFYNTSWNVSTVTLTATGGVESYEYSFNGSAFQSSNTFNPTTVAYPGTYPIRVRDAAGCIHDSTVWVMKENIVLSNVFTHHDTLTVNPYSFRYWLSFNIASSPGVIISSSANLTIHVQEGNIPTPAWMPCNIQIANPPNDFADLSCLHSLGTFNSIPYTSISSGNIIVFRYDDTRPSSSFSFRMMGNDSNNHSLYSNKITVSWP